MAIRENVIVSAVNFLQDPNVMRSPVENRIAFLHSKNLTKEEIDVALERASREPKTLSYPHQNVHQQIMQPPLTLDRYQQQIWQPATPKRDWRDWFIAATVMGSMGFGLYNLVKRYIYPMIAPPTTPQLEQDKREIEKSFEKAFSLLDQLAKDTEELKTSEKARTAKLDVALEEVETALCNLRTCGKRREDESRRIVDEVNGLRELIPKAMEVQKESNVGQLKELNSELRSLKILLSQRMNSSTPSNLGSFGRVSTPGLPSPTSQVRNTSAEISNEDENKASVLASDTSANEGNPPTQTQTSNIFSKGKAAIPSWQLAANRSTSTSKPSSTTIQEENAST